MTVDKRWFRVSLSGSGSRLGWHVGVLQGYLEDLHWECTEFRGSSGGGLVAVAAACNQLPWLARFLETLTDDRVYESAGIWGLWKGYRYSTRPLETILKDEGVPSWRVNAPIRLALYDLQLRAPLCYQIHPGSLVKDHWEAVMGTMAIPGIFPARYHGRWVDGCVTEAVPNIDMNAVGIAERLERYPWVVSVAMASQLTPLPDPPDNIKDILLSTLNGLVAEVVRTDLQWASTTPLRVHILPDPDRYDGMHFDPDVSSTLIRLGREDVRSK